MLSRNDITRQHFIIVSFLMLATFSIIGSSYVGLNGHQVWRQSDVFAQIQGFYGGKYHDPFQSYLGESIYFDTPLYQYCIAKLAVLVDAPPLLVTRFFNLACFATFLLCGSAFAEDRAVGGGVLFAFLAVTSPLFQHYFSVPLPDVLALALSMAGLLLLLYFRSLWGVLTGSLLFLVAALIKSPIPFVFLAYYGFSSLPSRETGGLRRNGLVLVTPLVVGLLGALLAEKIRAAFLGAAPGSLLLQADWYFGTLAQRLSPAFWGKMHLRLLDSFSFHILAYASITIAALGLLVNFKASLPRVMPYVAAFFCGWLVFSNVYYIHDYYELPVVTMVFLGIAESVGLLFSRRHLGNWTGKVQSACATWPVAILLVLLAGATVLYMPKIGTPRTVSVADSLRYVLRSTDNFVFVCDDTKTNPAIGGLTNTHFTKISKEKLESNCEEVLENSEAVLVVGPSACLETHKSMARIYIDDNGLQLFMPQMVQDSSLAATAAMDKEQTAMLASAFTTDDPNDYTNQVRLTKAGIRLNAQDLETGTAVFDLGGKFGTITLILQRFCKQEEALAYSPAPVSVDVKLDGRPHGTINLPANSTVPLRLNLSGVELLKLRFNGVARTPYDRFFLHIE